MKNLKDKIDQGTVIFGIKSEKYPSLPCYGIVITARCDIEQGKVPKYYFLEAVDAASWFCTKHGYEQVYIETIKAKMDKVCTIAQELELDGVTLLSISCKEIQTILNSKKKQIAGDKKLSKKINSLNEGISEYMQVAQIESDDEHRKQGVKNNSKTAISYIKNIDSGKLHHYHFIPRTAYLDNNEDKSKGLIVDFLEIRSLALEDAKKIATPLSSSNHSESGIYYSDLPSLPSIEDLGNKKDVERYIEKLTEYTRLKKNYWLENDTDFVAIEGTVKSPWCEHLMQRFSNSFARIGLDNPTDADYKALIESCYGG